MPKTTKNGQPRAEELPGTLQRSPKKAQETFAKAHDSAMDTYDDEERAHRVAFSAVKYTFEKVGDHWEPKDHKGPSDERAANPRARENRGRTAGGVDVLGQLEEGADGPGRQARHPRPLEDDQAGTRRGHRPQAGLTPLLWPPGSPPGLIHPESSRWNALVSGTAAVIVGRAGTGRLRRLGERPARAATAAGRGRVPVLPRPAAAGGVRAAGQAVLARLQAGGWADDRGIPSVRPRAGNPADALADPAYRAAVTSAEFNRLPYLPPLRAVVRAVLGPAAFSYPVKVLRAVYPERPQAGRAAGTSTTTTGCPASRTC